MALRWAAQGVSMFRNYLVLILSGLLVACGGGGGSDEPGSGGQLSADQLRAKEILEHCGSDAIDVLLGTLSAFAIAPGSTDLPIELLPIEEERLPFTADIDGDMQTDLEGVISFLDGDGQPFFPFTQEDLDGGIDALVALLSSLPTGAKMLIDLSPARDIGLETANLTVSFLGGIPISIDGFMGYFSDPCVVTLRMENVSPLTLLADVPTLTAVLTADELGDGLLGTVTLNGTNMARIDAALNGGDSMAFTLDLTEGTVAALGAG